MSHDACNYVLFGVFPVVMSDDLSHWTPYGRSAVSRKLIEDLIDLSISACLLVEKVSFGKIVPVVYQTPVRESFLYRFMGARTNA